MLGAFLVLIGADKGGVGKTTVTRLLAEYFLIKGRQVKIYDTQAPHGDVKRYLPDITEVIDIADGRGQCRLFDDLEAPGRVTLLDLKAGALFSTLKRFEDLGVFEVCAQGDLKISLLHVIGGSHASRAELDEIRPYREACPYRVVRNLATGPLIRGFQPTRDIAFAPSLDPEIVIPRLDSLAFETVELAGSSFSSFALGEAASSSPYANSFVLRGYVKTWLERSWDGFEAAGVDELVDFPEQLANAATTKTETRTKSERKAS